MREEWTPCTDPVHCDCTPEPDGWFDRSVCPEPCGSMHTICGDCGRVQGYCGVAVVGRQQSDRYGAAWLAVADSLEVYADEEWPYCDCGDIECTYGPCLAQRQALTVARTYLGRDS